MVKNFVLFFLMLFSINAFSQKATIIGKIQDNDLLPLAYASVFVKGENIGTKTNEKGEFSILVPANKNIILVFNALGFKNKQIAKRLEENEINNISINLDKNTIQIKKVDIKSKSIRREAGMVSLDAKNVELLPSTIGGVEGLIKILVGSKNEMTSQYSVRGGNYDENLVYINDFEVYRPFLARSGQQEGLSIINADLVNGIDFSTGGFQAKFGDKMSSVLDITYKRPKEFKGSASLSLLGVTAHLEGISKKNKLTYLVGFRQKSNQYLLQAQQTQGIYNPTFTDLQTFVNYQINDNWQMDVFANYARNRFDFQPQSSQQAFGVINQAFLLSMYFEGSETDKFDSRYGGISFTKTVKNNMMLKFIASGFQTNETETYDIYGQYNLGQLETDLGKENFGTVKVSLGDGAIHNYARNYLKINVGNLGHKGSLDKGKHFLQWGANSEFVSISDQLNEWERRDSAGFSLPYSDSVLKMFSRYKSSQDFTYARLSGYIQDNIELDSQRLVMTAGVRFNFNQLNSELLVSPRLQLSYKPTNKKDIVYKLATGFYHQPPFYREMRALDGSVNKNVKAQRSFHAVAGFDYNFKGFYEKPFKFTTELFYKNMWNVVPYEIDNVRIRYFGTNNARAFAYGAEFRLYGDLVKDAESFVSVALLNTKEDILNDSYMAKYKDTGKDSALVFPGYIPRPTDSRINVGLFFSDYLRNNKNFKVYINGLYGTGLPFGPPDNQRYGDTLRIPSYKRVDIGFAALLLDKEKKERPHYSIFKHVETAWLSLEVFNLLGIKNTLSYLWIRDNSSTNTYAVPNRLTARLLNAKLVVKF